MPENHRTLASAPRGQAEVASLLGDLRRRFANQLTGRIDGLRRQLQQLTGSETGAVNLEALHREVHGLTGAAGTFGLPEVSVAARALESRLAALMRGEATLDAEGGQTLMQALAGLEHVASNQRVPETAHSAASADAGTEPRQGSAITVHLFYGPDQGACAWHAALAEAGYHVQPVTDLAALCRDWTCRPPAVPGVLLLDLGEADAVDPALTLVRDLNPKEMHLVVLAALPSDDLALRLRASRAGVQRTLARPLVPERLVELLDVLTGRRPSEPYRVLLVDDEPLLLQAQAAVLRGAGMEVQAIDQPLQTLQSLAEFRPDVLVLDVYMPEASGPELAAALREREAWLDLPVLFLSAETDLTQQLLALNLGGDDFLVKPVQPDHLVAAVTARARRARQNSALRRRLQTSLYEREREHLALDHHAIVSVADPQSRILYANDLFCSLSGYTRDEALGMRHVDLPADLHPPDFIKAVSEAVRDGQVWQGEVCCRRRDGSPYWTETTITPFLDEGGQLYQYVMIQTDISHIKAAEAALRAQRDMQRVISLVAAELMGASPGRAHAAIDGALRASGAQLGADRAYLYVFSRDGSHMSNAHVWCAPGIEPLPPMVQYTSLDLIPWMRERFMGDDVLQIADVADMPSEAAADRAVLQHSGIRSLVVFPLQRASRPFGFLAYSVQRQRRDWTSEEVELLKVLRDVIVSALMRSWADTALRRSESRLNFLVSSSPVIIHTREAQPPFALRYVSPNVRQIMGVAPEAFSADPDFFASLLHPEDRYRVVRDLPSVLSIGELRQEYRLRMSDDRYRWILEQSRVARDSSGEPLEVIGYWIDITERKRIEAELFNFNQELEQRVADQTRSVIESERLAQATLDALSARVVILDEKGSIVAANQAWRNFGGGRKPEAIGNYLSYCENGGIGGDPNTQVSLAALAMGIRAVLRGEVPNFTQEYSLPIHGEPRWFVSRVDRFGGEGDPRAVVSHEDITPMKLAERQQLRSQRLESLGTLAGGVAHDLNNALAPVLMGMTLLKEEHPEESRLFDMIQGSAQRGADMVRQLLTFARGVEGERVPVRPLSLLHELERLMKGSFPKNIVLQVGGDEDLPPVLGDATQLHQVLLNLCVNARDAMPAGGTLALKAQVVEYDEAYARSIPDAKPGRYVALCVSDTGSGIPPDLLDRIFDPFFTTKPSDKGTGLGLSTVLGIVRAHAGFIQVYSQPGQGSLFTVYLPVATSADGTVPQACAAPASSFRGQGETVLFVDDETAVREVGRTVLERLNFRPVLATDGADGLVQAAAQRDRLRAVITDLHMPHMDGLAFVRALRRTLPDVPVILASGRVDEAVVAELQALGITRRLDKPFTQEQLARELRAVLGT